MIKKNNLIIMKFLLTKTEGEIKKVMILKVKNRK